MGTVTEAWQRNRLTDFCIDTELNEQEQLFLQSIVRLMDTSGILADNALAIRTVSFTVPWVASLISIYRSSDLQRSHLDKALNSASAACKALDPDPRLLPTASHWSTLIASIIAGPVGTSLPNIAATSGQIHSHMHEIASLVLLGGISHTLSTEIIEQYAAEIALGLISHSADVGELIVKLKQSSVHDPSVRAQVVSQLCSPGQSFNVMIPVLGAGLFDSIEKIYPSVRIHQLRLGKPGSFSYWGRAASEARNFMVARENAFSLLTTRSTPDQKRAFLGVTVQAPDKKAAAVIGRRVVTEALDQYVAGHPFIQFDIDDLMGVASSGKSHIFPVAIRPPIEPNARPLAIPWPTALRQAMRISHLLREASSPMTRVALAWVMIESSSLKKNDISNIGKALALKVLRQRVLMSYRLIVQDALDRELVRYYKRRSETRDATAKRHRGMASALAIPSSARDKLLLSAARSELLSKFYALLQYKSEQQATLKRCQLDRVNSAVNPSTIGSNRAYLPSQVPWLRLLDTDWLNSRDEKATSLRILLDVVSLPTRVAVDTLSSSIKSPAVVADQLATSCDWWVDVLNAFYAARNIHLHSGFFRYDGDQVLGELAVLIADSLFETWGTWYSNAPNTRLVPQQIAAKLAARFDSCISHLRSGGSVLDIDLDHITAPGWTLAQT